MYLISKAPRIVNHFESHAVVYVDQIRLADINWDEFFTFNDILWPVVQVHRHGDYLNSIDESMVIHRSTFKRDEG